MDFNKPYFTTSTINGWKHLLKPDKYKDIITGSLKFLSDKKLIKVYAFVIMPNHIHLVWELLKMNNKEKPDASLMKFTAHQFLKDMQITNPDELEFYRVELISRDYLFWQRDSLSIDLYTPSVFEQKIEYIHNNPLQEKWNLAKEPQDYKYSSAKFYHTAIDEFGFLNHVSVYF